jgi:hypothetical protein
MRSLPIQCGTIRITSATGERRDIRVSGSAKARLLWLFRNFHILDFPVLNPEQQQMIARMWNSESSAASKTVVPTKVNSTKAGLKAVDDTAHASLDLTSLDLIGTVEGYLPQLYAPPVPAPFRVGDYIKVPRVVAHPYRVRLPVLGGMRIRVIWIAMAAIAVLLLGGATALGPGVLRSVAMGSKVPGPGPGLAPPPRAAIAGSIHPVPATPPVLATPPVPAAPPVLASAAAKPSPFVVAKPPAFAAEAPSHQPRQLPDAMASKAASPEVTPPRPGPALGNHAPASPPANQEVMIRVRVDSEGHAQDIQVLQGDTKKTSAALSAAKHFYFGPCDGSSNCDHLLKFIEHGDASIVQRIE